MNPSPANAATGVVLTPTLTWTPGLGSHLLQRLLRHVLNAAARHQHHRHQLHPGHIDGEQEVLLESGGQGRRQVNQFTRLVIHDRQPGPERTVASQRRHRRVTNADAAVGTEALEPPPMMSTSA